MRLENGLIGHDAELLCSFVLDDPRFELWSGSHRPEQHHYGKGGLAQHTSEVANLCLRNSRFFNEIKDDNIRIDIVYVAAIWHDMGKMWDYNIRIEPKFREAGVLYETSDANTILGCYESGKKVIWQAAQPHKRNINHLCRSAIEWSKAVDRTGLCKDIHDEVLHCILSHHGNFGSPVLPKTREAWLLHTCDQMSARVDDADRLDLGVKK